MKVKINLIPPDKKEEIKNLKNIGTILKVFFTAIFSVVIFIVFIKFCYYFIYIQKKSQDSQYEKFQNNTFYQQLKNSQNTITQANQKSRLVKRRLDWQILYSAKLEKINQIIPEGVYLSGLKISPENLEIKGVAENRDDLLEFQKKLKEDPQSESLDSPISNIVSSENVNFEFKIKNKK